MVDQAKIDQYDLVEVIQVPDEYLGVMDIGDIGSVIEEYDEENFEIECIERDGSTKWLATLHFRHVRLRSKDPYNIWIRKSLTQKSIRSGALLGMIFGGLMGAGFGAITMTLNGIFIGLVIGLVLGVVTGVFTAALTVHTAGTTGGIGAGYFTGMLFGGVFGMIIGALIPTSLRMRAHTEGMPVLDALMMGRFETAILTGFLLSILATIVGVWIGGKNLAQENLKEE